jgi:flagellar basal body L-ring protein FlgH
VPSSQVADARIETVSRSSVDAARVAGFLGRFFMSFIPFR